jgi:hypothetical protein
MHTACAKMTKLRTSCQFNLLYRIPCHYHSLAAQACASALHRPGTGRCHSSEDSSTLSLNGCGRHGPCALSKATQQRPDLSALWVAMLARSWRGNTSGECPCRPEVAQGTTIKPPLAAVHMSTAAVDTPEMMTLSPTPALPSGTDEPLSAIPGFTAWSLAGSGSSCWQG